MSWETVIGLEIHAQLSTKSKIFSGSATAYGKGPNTQANLVDLAYPGVLPVLNGEAVRMAVKFGLAVDATIAERSVFARKNYFYPDLPKGYQISQYELPIVAKGHMDIVLDDGARKRIGITRAHLEEDAGKSLHEGLPKQSGIDLNRAGTPLIEIVSEPDMRSAKEAVAYLKKVHTLVRYLEICDGNMQEGSFRCDANVGSGRKNSGRAPRSRTSIRSATSRRRSTTKSRARSTCSKAAARWCRKRGSTTRTRARRAACARRKRRTTIATSRTPTCCRSRSMLRTSRT
jgi:aspartyl-tRNA(Asn)/glutamyl-tRNA(Gln) amidotransferase subunit B